MTENVENKTALQEQPYSINLVGASENQILELKLKYNIHASVQFLRDVGLCLLTEGIPVDKEILNFFDAIYLSATSRFENTDVSSAASCEGEVKRTLRDLVSKYKYSYDTDNDKIPFDDFIHVSSKYLSTLDISAPSTVCVADSAYDLSFTDESGNYMTSLALDNSRPLPFGYKESVVDTKSSIPLAKKGDVFIVLCLDNDQKDYKTQINELLKNPDFTNVLKTSTTIDCGGLLYALSQLSVGAVIYADTICGAESLSSLVNLHKGNLMITAGAENEELIKALAKEYSLSAQRIAESSDLLSFTIIMANKKINIRANFLRGLFKYRTLINNQIPIEDFTSANYEGLYVTKNGHTEKTCGVVAYKKHLISALKTSSCSFTSAINIVLDSIFALLAKGVSIKNIGISLKIGCDKNHKESALASLLGMYRVCVELSIPEKESIVVDSEKNYVFCCAYAKEEEPARPALSPDAPSCAYLLSFGRFNDTLPQLMPDFSGVRKMCILLEELFSNERIIEAVAVDGLVTLKTNEMFTPPLSLFHYFDNGINENTRAQGIIIQAPIKEKIKAPLIGVIRKG